MKRKIVLIVSLLVLVLVSTPLMIACAESPAPGPETPPSTFETIVWRFNANYAQEGTYGKMYRVFADNLEQRSGGRMICEVYYMGSLGYKSTEAMSVASQGLVDINEIVGPSSEGECPIVSIPSSMMFLFESPRETIYWTHEVFNPIFNKELKENWNSEILIEVTSSCDLPILIFSKEPLTKPEDFVGQKIRTWGGIAGEFLAAIGMTPFVISTAEIYTALQRGLIDNAITAYISATECKFWETGVIYINNIPLMTSHQWIIVNSDSLNALPEDLQDIVMMAGTDATNYLARDNFFNARKLRQQCLDNGMVIVEPEPGTAAQLKEMAKPVYQTWVDKVDHPIATQLMRELGAID